MFKKIHELKLGFSDAENYKRKENKNLFNKIFLKGSYLDKLLEPHTYFLIGEKGAGKTAYAVYLSNIEYSNTSSEIKYIRETEYNKFLALKKNRHIELSDFSDIWEVILLLLISRQIIDKEKSLFSFNKFRNLQVAVDEYYNSAFSPEISQAISFVEESEIAVSIVSKHRKGVQREEGNKKYKQPDSKLI
ncbi:TPA: hypothetical protein ACU16Q_000600 [Pasteurella multocida]|uniref:hypothetical protein n=1 Tax=Pasteurella multocida TaxID=747 RepID=UPI001E5F1064|nr:hypothetical protein [Pasteurella multocida]